MIQRVTYTQIYVLDQDAARDFYVHKLGFELREDNRMDNGFRWLTVGPKSQPELSLILMRIDGPNFQPEVTASLRALMEKGIFCGGVLETADCRATYTALQSKGVEFSAPPVERFYGIEAVMKDNSGNWYSVTQRTA
jgi:catechol 2,3-dioxygenase-like lactoylglutathione lyase family enzyme